MRKRTILSVLLLVLSLLLSACNNKLTPTSGTSPDITIIVKTDLPSSSVETAYPISEKTEGYLGTLYPAGKEPTSIPTAQVIGTTEPNSIPDSNPGIAAVYGVLKSYSDKQPLQGVMIYAADVVIVETSGDKIYTTQEKSSPHDATDNIGQFTITQIKPGNYLFMMVTPFGNYPIFDDKNLQVELELKAGDVIDFGEIYVNWP